MLKQSSSRRHRLALPAPLWVLIILLALSSLACVCGGVPELYPSGNPKKVVVMPPVRTRLPTLTPTALAAALPVVQATAGEPVTVQPTATMASIAVATSAPVQIAAAPGVTPAPTVLPTIGASAEPATAPTPPAPPASPTSMPVTSGWSFSGVTNLAGNPKEGLRLIGELVNRTGASQHSITISGAFYDTAGEVDMDNMYVVSYVPIDPVPADAHVPFELQVSGNQAIDRFDLQALSEPTSAAPRQDFNFSAVEQRMDEENQYCIHGQVENQGLPVQKYLMVMAVGYDDQGSVVSHAEYYTDILLGSEAQSSTFDLCLNPSGRQISRHDLKAFGL